MMYIRCFNYEFLNKYVCDRNEIGSKSYVFIIIIIVIENSYKTFLRFPSYTSIQNIPLWKLFKNF